VNPALTPHDTGAARRPPVLPRFAEGESAPSATSRPLDQPRSGARRRNRGGDSGRWIAGNKATLLENGEAFYPRVFEVIAAARREVLVETFILFDDKVGHELKRVLLAAAANGASVDLTIDGWGSAYLPESFSRELTAAGVRLHVFGPGRTLFNWRTNFFRRMHRKITVVDGERAFIGGINFSLDHLAEFGPEAKQDYAVELEGPIVATLQQFARGAVRRAQPRRGWLRSIHAEVRQKGLPAVGTAEAMLVTRDNHRHRTDIEAHYRAAIRLARKRVIIANAYFFPGYRLLKEMVRAAHRGVDVRLLIQGRPDMTIAREAPALLYGYLLRAGVKIHEYTERPFHGKVALVDDVWSTVGSSNLDPLSLSLNLEANVMLRDRAFNQVLAERLDCLVSGRCRAVTADELPKPDAWGMVRSSVVFHFLRHFPRWANWLPTHRPSVQSMGARR
jgi:cardiolipin synthase